MRGRRIKVTRNLPRLWPPERVRPPARVRLRPRPLAAAPQASCGRALASCGRALGLARPHPRPRAAAPPDHSRRRLRSRRRGRPARPLTTEVAAAPQWPRPRAMEVAHRTTEVAGAASRDGGHGSDLARPGKGKREDSGEERRKTYRLKKLTRRGIRGEKIGKKKLG